jgi:5-methyltetrahydropteroyltriglutamate--homocysteine methyltransferase
MEATNWALEGIPAEQVRFHTCWGSWHTPHVTDLPFRHTFDIMLKHNAAYFSVEAADVQHVLDYQIWETNRLPDGAVYIPGVIAHKTSTVEPPELVAHHITQYAKLMGRENVIAGVDCGLGNRCYPDIAWAKLRALADGAALASKQLW